MSEAVNEAVNEEVDTKNVTVTFSLDEVNQILNFLGDVPAKYSIDLVNFIRTRAQAEVKAQTADDAAGVDTKGE